jgi:hypothetical protein
MLIRGERQGYRSRSGYADRQAGARRPRTRRRVVLHDQMEEILGEVWRQEAWAQTEARIDRLVARLRGDR